MNVHPFVDSGETDQHPLNPQKVCARCPFAENSRWHDLPETPADVTEAERRRLGESE